MKRMIRQVLLALGLILLSTVVYILQISIFHSPRDTAFYLFQDLAFIPMQVLLITLIVNKLLSMRQKREMLKKLYMVIGAFFNEMGTDLLCIMQGFHTEHEIMRQELNIDDGWTEAVFSSKAGKIKQFDFKMETQLGNLKCLQEYYRDKRHFLLSLLENANLLEHDTFSDMLWAVFHVSDELANREDVFKLPRKDYEHLEGDIRRAYGLLLYEWLFYMKHLKTDYPYLYSLAVRKNPFNPDAKVVFGE